MNETENVGSLDVFDYIGNSIKNSYKLKKTLFL